MQALRGHKHDLGPICDLWFPQSHTIHQQLPCKREPPRNDTPFSGLFTFHLNFKEKKGYKQKREREIMGTFKDEFLATGKNVGERLQKGFDVFDFGVERDRDWNGSSTELHCYVYRCILTFHLHFLLFPFSSWWWSLWFFFFVLENLGGEKERQIAEKVSLPSCILMQKLWYDAFICENNSCPYD